MEITSQKPILVTITSPTAAGKSYLYNYIRDVAKLACLTSTTTRLPRVGEVEGLDYYFISDEESKKLEADGQFAELAFYGGFRYGVTKKEFSTKLATGLAFLIVEPGGIDHYAKPATDIGAAHYTVYVHTDPQVRIARFKSRATIDIKNAFANGDANLIDRTLASYFTRFEALLTNEMTWGTAHPWDRTVFGTVAPAENLQIILKDLEKIQERQAEVAVWEKEQADLLANILYRAKKLNW